MKKTAIALLIILGVGIFVGFDSFYIVDETEKAIVIQLGKPVGDEASGPGLHVKMPFVQNVVTFDARVLDYDAKPEEITTLDKKYMTIDSFSKWRISDPLLFYRSVRTVLGAQARLDDIIRSTLREFLGQYTLIEIVNTKRQEIMDNVFKDTREQLSRFGIEIVDVRIKRTDLPPENERAIYGRMKAERERQAKQYRSEGREAAARIVAQADKERTVILAEAERTAEVARGEGDADATRIYAEALGQSPDFYEFQRSLEAYRKGLKDNTRFIMTPETPFLKFLE